MDRKRKPFLVSPTYTGYLDINDSIEARLLLQYFTYLEVFAKYVWGHKNWSSGIPHFLLRRVSRVLHFNPVSSTKLSCVF
jgi:hypothetical protein